MSDIRDYLDWRGDLSFDAAPFCEVDNLVLCKLVSLNYTGIIPEEGSVPIAEAARAYFEANGDEDKRLGVLSAMGTVPLLKKMVASVRYGDAVLSDYINYIDESSETQFSALTISIGDGTRFISFRGTDDTIVAWKEDFNIGSFDVVPAQAYAETYLSRAAWRFDGQFRVGGHSKGGNLAVYAAMKNPPELQDRIIEIFNNDGPGFRESVRGNPEYQRIQPRLRTLVPQYSLVGMLLSHDDDFEIVESCERGISAHNGFTWQVLGTKFVRCESFALRSRIFEGAFRAVEENTDLQQRREFTDAFFDALSSTGAETLTDLTEHRVRQALEVAQNVMSDPRQKELLTDSLTLFAREYLSSARQALPKPSMPKMRLPKSIVKVHLRRKKPDDEASVTPEEAETAEIKG